jgi:glycosyltransferase involved in cell wall biosynthesis
VAKGVIPRPDATHICYCHSPARYIWDLFWTYAELSNFNTAQKMMVGAISQYLRMWDVTSNHRVTKFLANSAYTAQRIKLYYGRDADILHPPVRTTKFHNGEAEDFYLMLGRIVAYKGFGLAVDAFNESGKKLVIIGDGPDKEELVAKAKSNITFLGRAPDDVMMDQMARCKGFVFPGKEDFGIVMVEAQSAGKPVIALGQGGALDIVRPDETGVLFNEPTIEELNAAIAKNDGMTWDQQAIQDHAEQFNEDLFKQKLHTYIEHGEMDGALIL